MINNNRNHKAKLRDRTNNSLSLTFYLILSKQNVLTLEIGIQFKANWVNIERQTT